MRFGQRPYRFLITITLVALALVALLSIVLVQPPPVDPNAIDEYAALPGMAATIAISFIALLWLALVVVIGWFSRNREPNLVAASAWPGILLVALAALDTTLSQIPGSFDSQLFILDDLCLILAIGVQLLPIWHLAAKARPSSVGRLAAAVTSLATLVAAFAYVTLGPSFFDQGPQVEYVAYLAFCAGLAVLAAAAWTDVGPERPGLALVGGGALFYFVVGSYYYVAPEAGTSIVLMAAPIMALGWLWIGSTWLRAARPVVA